jgi:catechol 2,3-dioxygenase-like lactoylglutathione lyase family enzyme
MGAVRSGGGSPAGNDPPANRPGLDGVLETVLYYQRAEREAMHRFYGELLALPEVAGWPDGTAYRLGAGVVLIFCRELLAEREGPISAHGTEGPGHVCLLASAGDYGPWRARLERADVSITHEEEWAQGRSFYFEDPAGNLLEIASADIWPEPEGA